LSPLDPYPSRTSQPDGTPISEALIQAPGIMNCGRHKAGLHPVEGARLARTTLLMCGLHVSSSTRSSPTAPPQAEAHSARWPVMDAYRCTSARPSRRSTPPAHGTAPSS
jgi:hypothetical protein